MEICACAYCLAELRCEKKPLYKYESLCDDCISSLEETYKFIDKGKEAITPNSLEEKQYDHETHFSNHTLH
jgi:hypothetical protein